MAAEYEATAPPRKVAATKVEAFLDAFKTAREAGPGDVFVSHLKIKAAESAAQVVNGKSGEARADALLNEAYDAWDRAHPGRVGRYSTDELVEILALATTYATTFSLRYIPNLDLRESLERFDEALANGWSSVFNCWQHDAPDANVEY